MVYDGNLLRIIFTTMQTVQCEDHKQLTKVTSTPMKDQLWPTFGLGFDRLTIK